MILYYLRGSIVYGSQNGHKLGFPTANLDPITCLALPWEGGWTPALWSYLTQASTLDSIRKEPLPSARALLDQLLPLAGVYASAALIFPFSGPFAAAPHSRDFLFGDSRSDIPNDADPHSSGTHAVGPLHPGMTNLGPRPSVDDSAAYSIETHLFDCSQDLYGAEMELFLLDFLRPTQKFPSFDALSAQLAKDQARAIERLAFLQGNQGLIEGLEKPSIRPDTL